MTIIEAIRSGKSFKHKQGEWIMPSQQCFTISKYEMLSDEWEVEDLKFEVTELEIMKMLDHVSMLPQSVKRIWFERLKNRGFK